MSESQFRMKYQTCWSVGPEEEENKEDGMAGLKVSP